MALKNRTRCTALTTALEDARAKAPKSLQGDGETNALIDWALIKVVELMEAAEQAQAQPQVVTNGTAPAIAAPAPEPPPEPPEPEPDPVIASGIQTVVLDDDLEECD